MEEIRKTILLTTPRVLGFIDRVKSSDTYGCCDRYYWHYKLHDVANARFQEACLLLALLYSNEFEENVYFKNPKILEWVFGIIEFGLKTRNRDGSAVEIYPFERSLCATSFSTYAITESLLQLREIDKKTVDDFIATSNVEKKLKKTGLWISEQRNNDVANQRASSLLSLYNIYLLTNIGYFREAAERQYIMLKSDFQELGFFPEYGGFDLGYTTITTSYLACYGEKTNHDDIIEFLSGINEDLDNRIDSTGNYQSFGMSRNTQFLYTYGFRKTKSPVVEKIVAGLRENRILSPLWMDDRYCLPLCIDYLKTYIDFLMCT